MFATSSKFSGQTRAGSTCNGTVHTDRNAEAVTVSGSSGLVQALLQNSLLVWTRL